MENEGDDRLSLLTLARDTLVDAMAEGVTCPNCDAQLDAPSANLPQVVRELRATLAEIDALSGPQEESTVERLRDDLAAKRAGRSQAATGT